MSQKITGKNLHYDKTLPPFLARMRGEAPEHSDSPDPLLAMNRARGKPRSGSAEAEDAPVVIDEEGNVLSGMKVGVDGSIHSAQPTSTTGDGQETPAGLADQGKQQDEAKEAGKAAGIGAARKRKVGKVVGGDDDGEDDNSGRPALSKTEARKENSSTKEKGSTGVVKASKKEAKKIKLSFGDDEEG